MNAPLARPPMPGGHQGPEEARAKHMGARADLLRDRADDRIKEWLETHIRSERLKHWGAADTSANPLASFARQASTPGLYVRPPRIRGPAGSDGLVGEEGLLASLWPRMQRVQYYAVGLNSVVVRVVAVPEARRVAIGILFPHDVHVVAHPADPTLPVEVWELSIREWTARGTNTKRRSYVWDVWSIKDQANPFYRVHVAEQNGDLGEDVTDRIVTPGADGAMRMEGGSYPYWEDPAEKTRPVLPHVIYRALDDGTMWGWEHGRGAFRGSLNSMLNWSFAQHAARDASGSTAHAIDCEPVAPRYIVDEKGQPVSAMVIDAGTITKWRTRDGAVNQGQIVPMGPGVNLEVLLKYSQAYELNQLTRFGLNPTDITRTNNTPGTGIGIALSNTQKQQLQRQFAPLFRRADRELLKCSAIVARHAGLGEFPLEGYSVVYEKIKLSTTEEKEEREDLDWRLERSLLSPIDLYREANPGATSEDAVEAMARAEVEKWLIAQRTQQLAAQLGVRAPTPPPNPTPLVTQ